MAKKANKKDKQAPNIVVVLVEGESDVIALELPLSDLITEKNPDYEVRFLLQQKIVDTSQNEVDDVDSDEDDDLPAGKSYVSGGDITTSSYVTPSTIENKIFSRFIMPAVRREGLYPKKIAKIIHIIDLDGAYIPDDRIQGYSEDRLDYEKTYYDGEAGVIETSNVEGIINRNKTKRENIDYLLSLSDCKIRIKTKKIPYEAYFFSSNLDHFINYDANVRKDKKKKANEFLDEYGLETRIFCSYFLTDPDSLGRLGYFESWEKIRNGDASVRRGTNLDYLIKSLME